MECRYFYAKKVGPSAEENQIELVCNRHAFITPDVSSVNFKRNTRGKIQLM
jgi:hypothetical protein